MIGIVDSQIGYKAPLIDIEALQLSAGKLYALVGRNGMGKSTLLKTLIGQLPPLSGSFIIAGHPLPALQSDSVLRARQVAFVSSKFEGVEALTMRDYIALGRIPHLGAFGRMHASDWQIVDQTMQDLQIAHLSEQASMQLSDGEKQLASLARAIVQDTPVLVLDEPTSFLDFFNRTLLLDQLKRWVEAQPLRVVVFSSHDLEICFEKEIAMLVLANKKIALVEKPTKEKVLDLLRVL